jgi:hypothetical protein
MRIEDKSNEDSDSVEEKNRHIDDQLTIDAIATLRENCPQLSINDLVDECIARKKVSHNDLGEDEEC